MALALGLVAGVLGFLRIPWRDGNVIWAEDGAIFLQERLAGAPFANWFTPYDGYLHLVPRMLADLAVTVLPIERYAIGMTALTCLVAGGVGALVYVCSRDVIEWLPARIALAFVAVGLPTVTFEVLGNAANVHAILLWLAPWLILVRPRTRVGAVLLGVVGLVVGLTEIQAAAVLPFVFYRWRDRFTIPVRAGLALGIAAQLLTTVLSPRTGRDGAWPDAWSTFLGFVVNALMAPWAGPRHTASVILRFGTLVAVPIALAALVVLVSVLWRGERRQKMTAAILAWSAVVVWTAGFTLNPNPEFFYADFGEQEWSTYGVLRYGVAPGMFVAGLVLVFLAVLRQRARRPAARILPVVLLAAGIALTAFQVTTVTTTQREGGPSWPITLDEVEGQCEVADPPEQLEIPIQPPGWFADVPCDVLEPAG